MIQSDSLTDVNFDVSDNSSGIFRSVLKRGFVSKLPDAIKDRFNDKSSQARTTSIYTRPLKEKNKKTIRKKGDTNKGGQNGGEMGPNGLNTRAIKEAMVNCLLSRTKGTAVRINIAPILQRTPNLNGP